MNTSEKYNLIDYTLYEFDKNYGIYSKTLNKYLTGTITKQGYIQVWLKCTDGKHRPFLYHRVIAIVFVPNPENKPFVDHINGNRQDWKPTNLRWVTNKENCNFEKAKDNYSKSHRNILKNRKDQSKIVYQYTLDNKLISVYPSANEAFRQTSFFSTHINDACKGRLKTYKGYKWSYKPL